jgi:hypothetical protein
LNHKDREKIVYFRKEKREKRKEKREKRKEKREKRKEISEIRRQNLERIEK